MHHHFFLLITLLVKNVVIYLIIIDSIMRYITGTHRVTDMRLLHAFAFTCWTMLFCFRDSHITSIKVPDTCRHICTIIDSRWVCPTHWIFYQLCSLRPIRLNHGPGIAGTRLFAQGDTVKMCLAVLLCLKLLNLWAANRCWWAFQAQQEGVYQILTR